MTQGQQLLAALATAVGLAIACQQPSEPSEPAPPPLESAEEVVADPFLSIGMATSEDGLSVAYSTRGGGTPALVFLHGWSCDRSYWSGQIDDMARDYRVVTVDLGGHGDSGQNRSQWTFTALAEDVRAVVEKLDLPKVILVGHSMGGQVSLEAARLMPQRVVALVGVDTLHDVTFKYPPDVWTDLVASYERDFVGTCGQMVRSIFPATAEPALVERIEADMCSAPRHIALPLFRRFGEYDAAAAMASLTVPIRAINAAVLPTRVEANRQFSPNFDATLMEGVGHFLMMEKPAEFNELLRGVLEEVLGRTASSPTS